MTIFIAIALVALGVAAVMSGVSWRLAREEQRRSDARVAALAADLGTVPAPARQTAVRLSAIAMAVIAVASVSLVAAAIVNRPAAAPPSPPPPAPSRPLELVALEQQRSGDQLFVRGNVRNPAGTAQVDHLIAIVLAYNDRGDFVTSGRAPVEPNDVQPGAESTFAVTLNDSRNVARYRVSFRSDDRLLPHIDKRTRAAGTSIEP